MTKKTIYELERASNLEASRYDLERSPGVYFHLTNILKN